MERQAEDLIRRLLRNRQRLVPGEAVRKCRMAVEWDPVIKTRFNAGQRQSVPHRIASGNAYRVEGPGGEERVGRVRSADDALERLLVACREAPSCRYALVEDL